MVTEPTLDALMYRALFDRFVSVGVVGATIETIMLGILMGGFGVPPLAGKAIDAESSITTMVVINNHWTFAGEGRSSVVAFGQRGLMSHLVRDVGLSVGFAVLYF